MHYLLAAQLELLDYCRKSFIFHDILINEVFVVSDDQER